MNELRLLPILQSLYSGHWKHEGNKYSTKDIEIYVQRGGCAIYIRSADRLVDIAKAADYTEAEITLIQTYIPGNEDREYRIEFALPIPISIEELFTRFGPLFSLKKNDS